MIGILKRGEGVNAVYGAMKVGGDGNGCAGGNGNGECRGRRESLGLRRGEGGFKE